MANPNPNTEGLKPAWKPGETGNPKGRPAGISAKEALNALQDTPEDELREIANNKRESPIKRGAAKRLLLFIERADLADFQPVIEGKQTLEQMRQAGVNTEVVKKLKWSEHGSEIELHNRSGEEFDRICDRTDGKPQQSLKVIDDNSPKSDADRKAAADSIVADILDALGRKSAPAGEGEGPASTPAGQ